MKKPCIIGFTVALVLSFVLVAPAASAKPRGIPNWDEDYDTGSHQSWAYAYIYAMWNTITKQYQQHDHQNDGDAEEPGYYYYVYPSHSYDKYYPSAGTQVYWSNNPDGPWYPTGAYAWAQLSPLE